MKKFLEAIGVGLIAGVAVYLLMNKKSNNDVQSDSANADVPINRNDAFAENGELQESKASSLGQIYVRHQDAAEIIKEAVDTIDSATNLYNNVDDDLEQISNELDDLLDEE